MPLNLLDLPLVLVQDVLDLVVKYYTIDHCVKIQPLLNTRRVNSMRYSLST